MFRSYLEISYVQKCIIEVGQAKYLEKIFPNFNCFIVYGFFFALTQIGIICSEWRRVRNSNWYTTVWHFLSANLTGHSGVYINFCCCFFVGWVVCFIISLILFMKEYTICNLTAFFYLFLYRFLNDYAVNIFQIFFKYSHQICWLIFIEIIKFLKNKIQIMCNLTKWVLKCYYVNLLHLKRIAFTYFTFYDVLNTWKFPGI